MEIKHGQWLQQRFASLLEARQSYEPAWQDLADHFLPTRYRNVGKNPDAWRKMPILNDKLVDATGILAMRTLAAGLQGGMTSPARPWFQLSLEDTELANYAPMKDWLMQVSKRMAKIFNGSNFYNAVHTLYGELGTFGTAFMLELADFEHGFRFVPFCAGEYCLDTNARQKVDVVFRRFRMSTRQLMQHFGEERLPEHIRKQKHIHTLRHDSSHVVVHAIYPRQDRNAEKHSPQHMPFASIYWLEGSTGRSGGSGGSNTGKVHVLSESGFMDFPGFGVRWDVAGNDVYGRSPAMDVLPDCRMLQQMGITTLKAIHKSVDPPTAVSASLKSVGLDLTPGGVNYVEALPGQSPQAATPILDVRPDIQGARSAIQDVQKQIQQGLYNDLFRLLLDGKNQKITAKEVAVREEEKLILLGPALERLHFELFIPLIDRTFNLMLQHDMLPPMPEKYWGSKLKVEFVSLLAQAQKMVSTSSVDRLVNFVQNIAAIKPEATDALHADKSVDEYAQYLGVAPGILRSQEEREALRKTRLDSEQSTQVQKIEQEKHKQSLESMESLAKAAEGILKIKLDDNNIATAIVQALQTQTQRNMDRLHLSGQFFIEE